MENMIAAFVLISLVAVIGFAAIGVFNMFKSVYDIHKWEIKNV